MNEWFADEDFWRTFGDCMFRPETFRQAEEEIDKIRTLTGVAGGTVLDLGCGPGRHSIPLARAGYEVTGVDLTNTLLEQARELAGNTAVEWVGADMREFERPEAFDLALCMWTSFGYFEHEDDDATVLARIRRSLRPGGTLLLDVVGKEYVIRHLQPVHLTEYDDGTLLIERPLLTEEMNRYQNEWILIRDEQVHRAEWSQNLYTGTELTTLLHAAGFSDVALYGSLDGADYDLDAERLIAIAR